jgi:hypothetical protein
MINIESVGYDPRSPGRLGITWSQTEFEDVGGERYVKDVRYTGELPIENVRAINTSNRFHCPMPKVAPAY